MIYSLESINCVKNNWCHKWFDIGSKYRIHEYIKGPFATPKIVIPVPYMIKDKTAVSTKTVSCYCTKEMEEHSENIYSKPGIPDPWEEYLILNSFDEKGQKKGDDYRKIDFDIIKRINDTYLLYFGQGIPDPWKKWLHFESLTENGSFSDLKKDIKTYIAKLRSEPGSEMFETKKVCCPQCNKKFSTDTKEFDKCDNSENIDKYKIVTVIPMQARTKNNRIQNEKKGKKGSLKDVCIGTENIRTGSEKVKNFKSCQMEKDRNCSCCNKSYAKYLVCNAATSRKSKIGNKTSVNANFRDEKVINMMLNNDKPNFRHVKSLPLLSHINKHHREPSRSNYFLQYHSPSLGNCSCTSSINQLASYGFLKGCSYHCKGFPYGTHLQSALPSFYNTLGPFPCPPHHLIRFKRKSCNHSLELKLVCPKCEEKENAKKK